METAECWETVGAREEGRDKKEKSRLLKSIEKWEKLVMGSG